MKAPGRNLIDLLISFLDILIHPKILNSSNFILLRSRIIVFWMCLSVPLVISMFFHFYGLVGPWHPMILTLDYCIIETAVVLSALKFFGSFQVALYTLMFSLYLNTPVIVAYSGGLHSPSLIFFLFLPFGVFQLTKSLLISLIGCLIGIIEIFAIFYLHLIGWEFAGKGIIENYFQQLSGNILICAVGTWIISLIYSKSLAQVYLQISDAQRFKTIMSLSSRMVEEFDKPLVEMAGHCVSMQKNPLAYEQNRQNLHEFNESIFRLSALISDFRLVAIEEKSKV